MNAEFLRNRVKLFEGFDEQRLSELVAGSRIESFASGERLAHAGDAVHFLGIVLDGEVVATVDADGTPRELGRLGTAETFGEMALMTGDAALADLTAVGACKVMLVPLTLFQSHVMAEPRAVQQISRTIGERFRQVMADPANVAAVARKDDVDGLLALKGERPERLLILNCGSSSLKWSVFDTVQPQNDAHGHIERIGSSGTRLAQHGPRCEVTRKLSPGGHSQAFEAMMEALLDRGSGVIADVSSISAVGHRVVHGGEKFTGPVIVDDAVLDQLEALAPLAPLHNPVNVAGIREARRLFPSVPHVAVFDTAYHATLPAPAFLYGLPYDYYENRGIRRFGFHGSSHGHVALAAAQYLKKRPRELRIVSCHLGSGASLCAIDHGRSVDTTMGFTPGEGLVMGTRCGDLDAGIIAYLQRNEGISVTELDKVLNKDSGLLGLSGISSDMREIEAAADAGNTRALIAFKVFCYRVRKGIGALVAALGGIDALVFTAGIGQGSAGVRGAAVQGLQCMGIHLDEARNRAATGKEAERISSDSSPVAILVLPTDEERMIARESLKALSRDYLVRASEACRSEPIPVEVSAHHIHLSQEHVYALFGEGHELTKHADLSQPGQYACKEQLAIVGPKGRIERVRVLGPARKATQVEIAMTEQFKLGIQPPIRESGDINGTPGCVLEGPAGSVELEKGVICALRHIHMTPADALRYGVKDKSSVRVRVMGDREMVFGDVRVRVDRNFALAMHIDTDEANAANLGNGAQGFIDGVQDEG
ncbi:acetate/propionate family kinase [Haloferula sp. BvORR071]|uniref:acetate/propionate family kinase n=1 Tax=Haloferula sp. BvORR071 TaxID=1396141 RepID=UPI00055298F9|nr:acetate/propionate family kinase [Haloferula sp. BvORR071]